MSETQQVCRYTKSYENGDLKVIDCETCGFRHLWPIPTEDKLREIYQEKFGGDLKGQFKQRKKEDEEYWRRAFARRLGSYSDLLPAKEKPRILDIGCGTGNLLRFFRDNGWDIHGIEPSENFREILESQEIPFVSKLTDDMSEEDWERLGTFDVVNMSMLLEHIREPLALLDVMTRRVMREGSILTIESPNDFNPLQESAVEYHDLPRWWIHQLHINYFDFPSLESVVRGFGLKPALRDAQFPMEMFLLFGDVYIGDGELGRACHKKRVQLEEVLHATGRGDLAQKMYQSLAEAGIGRTVILHSIKESVSS